MMMLRPVRILFRNSNDDSHDALDKHWTGFTLPLTTRDIVPQRNVFIHVMIHSVPSLLASAFVSPLTT